MEEAKVKRATTRQRVSLLRTISQTLEKPVSFLGFIWLALVIASLVLPGRNPILSTLSWVIWGIFAVDFLIRFALAPKRVRYLKKNWLVALSLMLPALGIIRFARIIAMVPSWELLALRLFTSVNRSLKTLAATMQRRGAIYVAVVVAIVIFAGAAGMLNFERPVAGSPMQTYGYAVWWTAMLITTMGSDYFPHTTAGRLLCFVLTVFGFSLFGYVTGALSSFFVNRDAEDDKSSVPSAEQISQLIAEVKALRTELRQTP